MRFTFHSDPQIPDSVRPPVIITGMHRSGTTLLTTLLSRLGLFVGAETDGHVESLFFQRLNEWMLQSCDGAWDRPEPFIDLLDQETPRSLTVSHLRYILSSPRARHYAGWRAYLRHGGTGLATPWGWKDPRSTITLPLWLELFPDAKVIHIKRHGVDVARSLKKRADAGTAFFESRYHGLRDNYGFLYWLRWKQGGFSGSTRCATLNGGLALWDTYVTQGVRVIEAHRSTHGDRSDEDRVRAVEYESFLHQPTSILRELVEFCGLSAEDDKIREASANVNPSRAFAYRSTSELADFAQRHSDVLERHGYEP